MASRRSPESGREKALTRIHTRIHCGTTRNGDTPEHGGDLDSLMIEHFLDTLADIATVVAERACKGET